MPPLPRQSAAVKQEVSMSNDMKLWNFEADDESLMVCRGGHENSEHCEAHMERLSPHETLEIINSLRSKALELEARQSQQVHGETKYTEDRQVAQCPGCQSLNVGAVGGGCTGDGTGLVDCHDCGLTLRVRGTMQDALDIWNAYPRITTAPAAVPEQWRNTIAFAAGHLKTWLDESLCECEMGHTCGRPAVERTQLELMDMLAGTPAPAAVPEKGFPGELPAETGLYEVCYKDPIINRPVKAFIPFCTCHGWAKHQVDIWAPGSKPKSSRRQIDNMIYWTKFPAPAPAEPETVQAFIPKGWEVEKEESLGVTAFIVRSPAVDGVQNGTAVFEDSEDPAEQLLFIILLGSAPDSAEPEDTFNELYQCDPLKNAPRYTTSAGESIAGIALRQLGTEDRWTEIRDLNEARFPGMQQHEYYPVGTVLLMPEGPRE